VSDMAGPLGKANPSSATYGLVMECGESSGRDYWLRFLLIYSCGVLAATSISKVVPVSVALRDELGLSLDEVALVASSATLVAALLGIPVSYLIGRLVPQWPLIIGCVVMAVGGFLGSRTERFGSMMVTRLLESVGYVAVVVAAPALIIAMGGGSRRSAALAVWGTFMPVGLALGSFAGGALSTLLDWHTWFAVDAAILLLVGVTATIVLGGGTGALRPSNEGQEGFSHDRQRLWRLGRPVLLAFGFATASGTIVAVISLFPTYLHDRLSVPVAEAGTLTGAVSLVGVIGGFLAGWMLRRGLPVKHIFLAALLMPIGTTIAFLEFGGLGVRITGAIMLAVSNELVVAAVFAAIPMVVSQRSDISIANGLVAQLGSLGSLTGPPVASLAVLVTGGWWAVAPVVLTACGIGVVFLRTSMRPATT
jgi:predicted MFS family arabinose efflux permease